MLTVIFDLDGLMFDTNRIFSMAWDYAGEKMGIGKAGYMISKTKGMSIATSKDIWEAEFGDRYDENKLRSYTKEFLQEYYKINSALAKKGLFPLLEFLSSTGCKMAVASSSPRWEVEKHLADAKITEYFDVVVCGDMINKSKPDPEIYIKVCKLLERNPEECYALEDSKNGLLAAYRAGCRPIMVPDLWQADEEIEKILYAKFESLEEVKNYFSNRVNYKR